MSILMGLARDARERARELRKLGLNKLAENAEKEVEALEEAHDRVSRDDDMPPRS